MTDEDISSTDTEQAARTLDAIAVPVTAVVGEIEIAVARARKARGRLRIRVTQRACTRRPVQLYTGRRHVGTGKLIALGERLGVRLIEWKTGGQDGLESA